MVLGPPDSQLANRVDQLWQGGALYELEPLMAKEMENFAAEGTTLCHQIAFEFAYGVIMTTGERHPSLSRWHWCIAKTVREVHSWVEHQGEAFDVSIISDGAENIQQMGYVRLSSVLRVDYEAVGVQSCSFLEFCDWLRAPKRTRLFDRYIVVSDLMSGAKQLIRSEAQRRRSTRFR